MKIQWKSLILCLLLPLVISGLGGLANNVGMPEYEALAKPFLQPPNWVFPVVWTILFLLMGVSAYLVKQEAGRVPVVYYVQLAVNLLWTIIFFLLQWRLLAFLWLLLLLTLVLVMFFRFRKIRPLAGWLQLPYILWLVFAAYLNLAIWLLNS